MKLRKSQQWKKECPKNWRVSFSIYSILHLKIHSDLYVLELQNYKVHYFNQEKNVCLVQG